MRHQKRWTLEKIKKRLGELESFSTFQRQPLPPFRYLELESAEVSATKISLGEDQAWREISPHTYWGKPRTNFLLWSQFTVPSMWAKDFPIALYLPLGEAGNFSHPEALVYLDGTACAACDRHHQEVYVDDALRDGAEHQITLHGWTGIGGMTADDMTQKLKMGQPSLVQIHPAARDFLSLTRVALGVVQHLEERDPTRHHLLNALDGSFQRLNLQVPSRENFYRSLPEADQVLREGIEQAGPPLDVEITAAGHAHLDVAWLWPLSQTRRKARRTFYNTLRLMERYPDYHFTQSQPQLYDFIREDDPELFQAIKSRVEEGRWETLGGMWVEADCNISGGESLVRQFMLGRSFFQKQFGSSAESPVLWLPDVFGYAWNLPQLIKEAGLAYFFTIKIGWNQYNRLPHDSFWWQGLDGTRVLTHFSTTKNPDSPHAATYNSDASPGQIMGTWLNFQDKDYGPTGKIPPLLMSYGWGDGGGGPTREMIENIREMEDFPGAPRVRTGKVIDFFRDLEAVSEKLPVWNGELYLEYHRGTYTTQAAVKRANRKSEFDLHDAEFLAAYASLLDEHYPYPHKAFEKAWKWVCLNQFHDILPGSSIARVYGDALDQYREVREITERIKGEALKTIAEKVQGTRVVINPTSFHREEVVEIGEEQVHLGPLPPFSITSLDPGSIPSDPPVSLACEPHFLENEFLRVELDEDGDITRIFDKRADREVLAPGLVGNQFQAFEDRPLSWDAWDIDIYYDEKRYVAEPARSIEVIEEGPLRGTLEITRRILNSEYRQRISLSHHSPRLDFETEIDWQERKTLLKVAFPVSVLSTTATYEIQWGNVERPTHRNTSWDWARFETAAQKWVDLSEGGYGVSLLNDCKYGHDIHDNVLRLTLLRGTTAPDPRADLGRHRFTYSLFPHTGSWGMDTIREAYALNDPLIVYDKKIQKTEGGEKNELPPLLDIDPSHIVVETVKRAENERGIIVRLYEAQRRRGPYQLTTGFSLAEVWRTNILEEDQQKLEHGLHQVRGTIRPYQILTLRLIPEGDQDTGD